MSAETLFKYPEVSQEILDEDAFSAEETGVSARVLDLGGSLSELVELDLDDSSIDHLVKPVSTEAGSSGS